MGGCGCGGSGARRDVGDPNAKPKRGPGSEGYYWTGPKRERNGPPPKESTPPQGQPKQSD